MTTPYERSKKYSNCKIDTIRHNLSEFQFENVLVLTCGSFARREASSNSDIDYFIVSENGHGERFTAERIQSVVSSVVPNPPASDGAFAKPVDRDDILKHIGGEDDSNMNITRRILFLLEGEWLYNRQGFEDFRRQILSRYIQEDMADHQLALFLLNDIIRYCRTIAVDYEYKISGAVGKAWAIRNIKLVFSRKLLYASGLFSIARTVDRTRNEKINVLENLFSLPVMDRVVEICGETETRSLLRRYNNFLGTLEDEDTRRMLESLSAENKDNKEFRNIKNEGHRFTRELLALFENTFHSTHPIWRAVMF